ncbi:hypothetical protein F5H01DRAFT_358901 [Linnemannia elongata]|nr:hypothetical protein F5H01DRAFT_358901 [Linnemannia elongata]
MGEYRLLLDEANIGSFYSATEAIIWTAVATIIIRTTECGYGASYHLRNALFIVLRAGVLSFGWATDSRIVVICTKLMRQTIPNGTSTSCFRSPGNRPSCYQRSDGKCESDLMHEHGVVSTGCVWRMVKSKGDGRK